MCHPFADGARAYVDAWARSLAATVGDMVAARCADEGDFGDIDISLAELSERLGHEGWTPARIDEALVAALSFENETNAPLLMIYECRQGDAWAPSVSLCGSAMNDAQESRLQMLAEQA